MRPTARTATILATLILAVAATVVVAPVGAAPGYRLVAREVLEPGVEHLVLRQDSPPQNVHVARLAPGLSSRLRPVLSRDVLTGPGAGSERTSSMCARVRCVVAVNGDFLGPGGLPVGAMVARGELVTTPGLPHTQLHLDRNGGALVGEGLAYIARAVAADGRGVDVARVNRPLAGEAITLYSQRWGPSTLTDASAVEVVLQLARPGVLPAGTTAVTAVTQRAGGNSPIGPGQVVLSGRGAGARALAAFARSAVTVGATVRVDTAAAQSTGASPHLLSQGRVAFAAADPAPFVSGRNPRTMVGLTAAGETLLVTADGRQSGSAGLSLPEAANLMAALGATEAVNLDGGGSTTFVTRGAVRNVPSDGGERPVVSALALVAPGQADPLPAAPPSGPRSPLDDPASVLPALVDSLSNLLAGRPL